MRGFIAVISLFLMMSSLALPEGTDLDAKIGQMLMVWFEGPEVGSKVESIIRDFNVGGVVLFRWAGNLETAEQIAELTSGIQNVAKQENRPPLFISLDQEGGNVVRIPGATDFPGNMALGATEREDYAYSVGNIIGNELSALGINMDLAPVLDVNVNPDNPVIGLRSFGEDPELVSKLGSAYVRGLKDSSVISVGKHFPGHGDTATDSHTGLPVVNYSADVLERIHLKPFSAAIKQGLPCIMTAHIIVEALDKERPATLSEAVLTELLRKRMNFKGVIMTDAMNMAAISQYYGPMERASVEAIKAGADIVLMPQREDDWYGSIKSTIDEIKKAVVSGEISEKRIDESYARIMNLKKGISIKPSEPANVGSKENRDRELEIARSAITLVRDDEKIVPLDVSGKLLVVVPTATFSAAEDPSLDTSSPGYQIKKYHDNTKVVEVKTDPDFTDLRRAVSEATSSEAVIIFTQRAKTNKGQITLTKKILELKKPTVVVSMDVPYDIGSFPEAGTCIAIYGKKDCNLRALADVLFGKAEPEGKLPVTVA
jgi:beta-N-acetylhexosaminidase